MRKQIMYHHIDTNRYYMAVNPPFMDDIFVFGSNLAGRHGAGAAYTARTMYGAKYGQAVGIQGRSYAIPTKDANLQRLPLEEIKKYVDEFKAYAEAHPELKFYVTRIGCGLSRYQYADIAPMFKGSPSNCRFAAGWMEWIG